MHALHSLSNSINKKQCNQKQKIFEYYIVQVYLIIIWCETTIFFKGTIKVDV